LASLKGAWLHGCNAVTLAIGRKLFDNNAGTGNMQNQKSSGNKRKIKINASKGCCLKRYRLGIFSALFYLSFQFTERSQQL
jgi:hypothetical protein